MNEFKFDIEGLREMLPWILSGGAGVLGRLMFHAKQVQLGKRKPFTWVLFWDIPIALGMGWMALGLGVWLEVTFEVTISIALATSYLGPHIIDILFNKWSDKVEGKANG